MLDAVLDLLPDATVGYVGMERDETTAIASSYYCKLPPLEGRTVLLLDPMLATGGSAAWAVNQLYEAGGNERHAAVRGRRARRRGATGREFPEFACRNCRPGS